MKKYIWIFAVMILAACAQSAPARVMPLATATARATKTAYYWGSVERLTTIDANTTPGWIEVTPNASQVRKVTPNASQVGTAQIFLENPGGNKYVRQNLDGGMWVADVYSTATPSITPSPTITLTPSMTPLVPVAYTLTYTPTTAPTVISQIPFYVEILKDKRLPIYGYPSCAGNEKGALTYGTFQILEVTSHNGKDYCGKLGNKAYILLIANGAQFTSWAYGQDP